MLQLLYCTTKSDYVNDLVLNLDLFAIFQSGSIIQILMANYYNQQDLNKLSGQSIQTILKKIPIYTYEIVKWLIDFVKQMYKMVVGK